MLFMTKDSFFKGFKSVFLHDNTLLKKRIWSFIDRRSEKRGKPEKGIIGIEGYLKAVKDMFAIGKNEKKQMICFEIYDKDGDGFVTAPELCDFLTGVPQKCPLWIEAK